MNTPISKNQQILIAAAAITLTLFALVGLASGTDANEEAWLQSYELEMQANTLGDSWNELEATRVVLVAQIEDIEATQHDLHVQATDLRNEAAQLRGEVTGF